MFPLKYFGALFSVLTVIRCAFLSDDFYPLEVNDVAGLKVFVSEYFGTSEHGEPLFSPGCMPEYYTDLPFIFRNAYLDSQAAHMNNSNHTLFNLAYNLKNRLVDSIQEKTTAAKTLKKKGAQSTDEQTDRIDELQKVQMKFLNDAALYKIYKDAYDKSISEIDKQIELKRTMMWHQTFVIIKYYLAKADLACCKLFRMHLEDQGCPALKLSIDSMYANIQEQVKRIINKLSEDYRFKVDDDWKFQCEKAPLSEQVVTKVMTPVYWSGASAPESKAPEDFLDFGRTRNGRNNSWRFRIWSFFANIFTKLFACLNFWSRDEDEFDIIIRHEE